MKPPSLLDPQSPPEAASTLPDWGSTSDRKPPSLLDPQSSPQAVSTVPDWGSTTHMKPPFLDPPPSLNKRPSTSTYPLNVKKQRLDDSAGSSSVSVESPDPENQRWAGLNPLKMALNQGLHLGLGAPLTLKKLRETSRKYCKDEDKAYNKKMSPANRQSQFWYPQYFNLDGVQRMEDILSQPPEKVELLVPLPSQLAISRLQKYGCDITKAGTQLERDHLR